METPDVTAKATTAPVRDIPSGAIVIVPVRDHVLFPEVVSPIAIRRPMSVNAAQAAMRESKPFGVLMQRDASVDEPAPGDMHRMGTLANVLRYVMAPDETHHLIVQGTKRVRIVEFLDGWPFLVARVEEIEEPQTGTPEAEARLLNLRQQAVEAVQLLPQAPRGLAEVEIAGFELLAGRHQAAGADDHVAGNLDPVEHDGADADQYAIRDGAAVQRDLVADDDIVAEARRPARVVAW